MVNIPGIVFEASISSGFAEYRVNSIIPSDEEGTNNIINVYSSGSFLATYDSTFTENGVLPKKFYNPNVYDTACLVATTCTTNEQYVPFCKQVLNQHGDDPVANFNDIVEAYNKFES